jgi:hypothetical protein
MTRAELGSIPISAIGLEQRTALIGRAQESVEESAQEFAEEFA